MGEQRINHFTGKRVDAHYWSQTDGFVIPLVGFLMFGTVAGYGVATDTWTFFWLSAPIAAFMLFLIVSDILHIIREKNTADSSDSNSDEEESK